MKNLILILALALISVTIACDKKDDLPDDTDTVIVTPTPTEYLTSHTGRYDIEKVLVDGVDESQHYIDKGALVEFTDTLLIESTIGYIKKYKYTFDSISNIMYRIDGQDTATNLIIKNWTDSIFYFQIDQPSPIVEYLYTKKY